MTFHNKERLTILIVDDTPENIDVLVGILKPDYKIKVASNGKKALKLSGASEPPDLILLDIMMPEMDGFEVCRRLKASEQTKRIPVIFVTAKDETIDEMRGFDLGAVDYITKPVNPAIVKSRVKTHLSLKEYQNNLEDLVLQRTKELRITQEVTIESLGTLAEYRDPETGGHIKRTQNYVQLLSHHLSKKPKFKDYFNEETLYWFFISAPLHDIGKVAVPDNILLKSDKLTNEEWEEMKNHTVYGKDTIEKSRKKLGFQSFLKYAEEIAFTHHERYDGTGYPRGIKGEDIPLSGRIMAIADVYDALISKRVYKPPFSHDKAVKIITEGDGRTKPEHFDPVVLQAFKDLQSELKDIAIKNADFEEEAEAWKSK